MKNKISILLITYNRPKDLLELLINLKGQDNLDDVLEEILILNNASIETYDEVLRYIDVHPELKARYIYSDINHGVAGGRNILIPQAKGPILLTIDDDMVFPKTNDLELLSQMFDKPFFKEANTAIITFRVIYYDNKEVQISAFPHKKYSKYGEKNMFLTGQFAGGANIMKRELFDKVGLFPSGFHYGMEEYDLLYRVLEAGYTLGYDGEVTVEHKESRLGRQPNYKKLQMQWLNKSKVAWRYLPMIYFISTAVAWSFQYLRGAKGHLGTYFSTWFGILKIPFTEKRKVITKPTQTYLQNVEARLWF